MKKTEIITLSAIALLISSAFLLVGNAIGFFASFYQLIASFVFFVLNATSGLDWLRGKDMKAFFLRSLVPFLVAYTICVILYTFYMMSLSKNDVFKLKYIFSLWPNKESILLPGLYLFGLFYGYVKRNKKAIKYTIGAFIGSIILAVLFYLQPFNKDLSEIKGVQFIEGHYTSIEELIQLPQFKNQTVYIDLWYSSCAPCVMQFKKHLPGLKTRQDVGNINYLYLGRETSHLDSKHRWHNAITEYNLKGWHYYFQKADEQSLWNEIRSNANLKFEGYPHYLIAKNGKIITYDAPKPSELNKLENLSEIFNPAENRQVTKTLKD